MPRLILQLEEPQQRQVTWLSKSTIGLAGKRSFSAPALEKHPSLRAAKSPPTVPGTRSQRWRDALDPVQGPTTSIAPPKLSSQAFSQLTTYQLQPFLFTWLSMDGASSSQERWTLIRENCSSQLLQSKVKHSLMSQNVIVKVSATDLARKVVSSQSTSRARATGTTDLRFLTGPVNIGQKTIISSQSSLHQASCGACLTWFGCFQGPGLN